MHNIKGPDLSEIRPLDVVQVGQLFLEMPQLVDFAVDSIIAGMFAPNVSSTVRQTLPPLLDFVASLNGAEEVTSQEWKIRRVNGGWNNLLYRATNPQADLAIKFSVVDQRDRAGREYHALAAIEENGLDIAPAPVFLDRDRYPQPVMVQTWLAGQVSAKLPTTDDGWDAFLHNLVLTHTVTPETTTVPIRPAVLTAFSPAEATSLVHSHLIRLPTDECPTELHRLLLACDEANYPDWPSPSPVLCHVDSNILNFIRRPQGWAGVDWENSGWGDPAYEIADLTMHAAHINVPIQRQEWIVDRYCELADCPEAAVRIRTYRKTLAVWWSVRIFRYLYEIPRGLDPRLATMPDNWNDDMQAKYQHYVTLAESLYL